VSPQAADKLAELDRLDGAALGNAYLDSEIARAELGPAMRTLHRVAMAAATLTALALMAPAAFAADYIVVIDKMKFGLGSPSSIRALQITWQNEDIFRLRHVAGRKLRVDLRAKSSTSERQVVGGRAQPAGVIEKVEDAVEPDGRPSERSAVKARPHSHILLKSNIGTRGGPPGITPCTCRARQGRSAASD
jgi:hypothetical protein